VEFRPLALKSRNIETNDKKAPMGKAQAHSDADYNTARLACSKVLAGEEGD
jgi:hypothetical protein